VLLVKRISLAAVINAPAHVVSGGKRNRANSIGQWDSSFRVNGSQPLTSISDAASPELLEQLTAIETNYPNLLQSLGESELSPEASKEPPGVPKSEVGCNSVLNTSDGAQANVV